MHIAPAYDLLSTAAYDTKAPADEGAHWPQSPLAITLGNAATFGDVRRAHLVEAARMPGIAAATAERNLDRMVDTILGNADRLMDEIESDNTQRRRSASAADANMLATMGQENRLLNTVRHVVLADMVRQLE